LRITFLILLLNSLFFTQIVSAVSEDVKLKGALLKAMKTHDTQMVEAIANGGYEVIDRDDVLQERIYNYLEDERLRKIAAQKKIKADALAKQKAKEQAKLDAIAAKKAAEKKLKTDAIAKDKAAVTAAAAAVTAKKAAEAKKKKDALAAKKRAKKQAAAKEKAKKDAAAKETARKKAAADKKRRDAIAAKKAKDKKTQQAKAAQKKRQQAAAAKKKTPKKQVKAKKVAPKKVTAPTKVVPKAVVAAPVAAAAIPLTISDNKLVGTWKQVSSEKVITLVIEKDASFSLEQVEDDGTLTILGTWKSEENILMLSIKKVQRNVHTRETNIHRIYKVERLSKHRLVLRDKRNRIAYDLKR
jgi:chemotaxis protein histidine kinase CheA